MAPKYQAVIAGAFVDFLDKGYAYKGLKPVNWCMHDRTALAEAEVEYADHKSPSVWVRFALTSDPALIHPELAGRKVFGLIWTTTPWTLPANLAIAFHPKYEYVAVAVDGDVYVVAADLLEATAAKCNWNGAQVVAHFHGNKLEGTTFQHPFMERISVGILGDHVTLEQGTGAVHTAPGHGQDDYVVGMQWADVRSWHQCRGACATDRQDGVGSESAGDWDFAGARGAAGAGRYRALVSALLALSSRDDFPCDGAVVHRDG
jgi:isoleucyl-tRNA synthetase